LILASVLFGCVPKPIDIDVKAADPKLVLASQVIPNQIMIVSLTRSFSALEGQGIQDDDSLNNDFLDKILVENAIVTVTYFGVVDTLYMISPGVYGSINTLQYNYGTYTLYAKDPQTGEEINATTLLIPQVQFDTIYPQVIKNPGDTVIKVNYTFHDDPSAENYYVVNYIRKSNSTSPLDINQVFSQGSNGIIKEFELLDDNSFTNSIYSVSKELEEASPHDSIAVMLSHISKGYFEYLNAFKKSGAIINQLTGEPINYPTNVNNGYGYFNAYYPSTRIFDLNNY
jgi:hypothetical protein